MKNYGASVRSKLLELSRERHVELTGLLIRYATDRLLYRLSLTDYRSNYVLKGSLLFSTWNAEIHRPTKDADLLGFGSNDSARLLKEFKEMCSFQMEEDGITFDLGSLTVDPIRQGEEYDGKRVKVIAHLDGAKIPVQIDIGYGDISVESLCKQSIFDS